VSRRHGDGWRTGPGRSDATGDSSGRPAWRLPRNLPVGSGPSEVQARYLNPSSLSAHPIMTNERAAGITPAAPGDYRRKLFDDRGAIDRRGDADGQAKLQIALGADVE